ncbi:MAG: glycoside hydrolase family 38 C-terminal domain-containing protein [Clostridiales bacterium]|nr:glycoside hydrolase family 38 C-terminal domain-containing protein [Clostridiales bacterium]
MKHPIWFIGNAHIDPVWLWRWQEGFAEIKATFRSALDRMNEFEDFIFTCAGACYYQWVEENEPAMFEEIRRRVQEGRWVIAGGWWLQPDCNAPCGESFARHSLYSQRYYEKTFGTRAQFGYNVDSFGHNGMIPQLLSLSGMPRYVMMRPGEHEKALNADAFVWEGVDGTRIPVFRIPFAYCGDWGDRELSRRLDVLTERVEEKDEPYMLFYGVGNHGGGPTIANLRAVVRYTEQDENLRFGQPGDYFDYVEKNDALHLTVKGDLQHHAIGCYSACRAIKRDNRRAENRLLAAEKWMTAAMSLMNLKDYSDKLRTAWADVMFNQFHDIMGGCAIKAAYEDARELHGEALKLGGDVLNAALQRISWHIDTQDGRPLDAGAVTGWEEWERVTNGTPYVVFNPNVFPVDAVVPISSRLTGAADETGAPLPFQNVRSEKNTEPERADEEGVVSVSLPPLGWRTIYLKRYVEDGESAMSTRLLKGRHDTLENDWVRLTFNRTSGALSSIYDKTTGRELLASAALAEVIEDYQNDTWAHAKDSLAGTIGAFGGGSLRLVENGAVCAVMRCESHYNDSTLIQDFTLYRDKPDIDVRVRLDWRETFRILKLSFPLKAENTRAVYEIPYGFIEKPANGEEEPGQAWAAVCGEQDGEEASLAVLTDSCYSYCVDGSALKFIAVRSAGWADHFGLKDQDTLAMDLGWHEFAYSIVPGAALDPAELTRRAAALNQPPIVVRETFHRGELPRAASQASVGCDHVLLNVIKPAEDGEGLIVRLSETANIPAHAQIDLPFANASFEADFKPLEIKTFRVDRSGAHPLNLLEEEL